MENQENTTQPVIDTPEQNIPRQDIEPVSLLTPLNKSKSVRVILEGEDYLDFNELSARLVFPATVKMNERAIDEAIVRFALSRLVEEVQKRVAQGEKFIRAASL